MSQKHETLNLFEVITWEEFKLWLIEKSMPHHLVLKDKMELLELAQGDGVGSLACYV
jgi:hypothetical protein